MSICRTPASQPKRYLIGNAISIAARLTSVDGEVVDPANLRLLFKGPSDGAGHTTLTMTVEDDHATASFTPDETGLWWYRVETFQGPVTAASEMSLTVVASAFNL